MQASSHKQFTKDFKRYLYLSVLFEKSIDCMLHELPSIAATYSNTKNRVREIKKSCDLLLSSIERGKDDCRNRAMVNSGNSENYKIIQKDLSKDEMDDLLAIVDILSGVNNLSDVLHVLEEAIIHVPQTT